MSDAPGSYFVLDPGRSMGFAYCLAGGGGMRHGTWKFQQPVAGEAYATFVQYLKRSLSNLPDPLVGIELMTIVDHGTDGKSLIDAKQVIFSSGWPTHVQTLCHSMGLREPQYIAIPTWRSKTHGKLRAPKEMTKQTDKTKWFKQQAKTYCDRNGWSYNTDDEAEALCMLDALRIMNESAYAFDRGRSYEQESML